jgi:hypothetical protein
MVPRLKEVNAIFLDQVHESVLQGDAPRPGVGPETIQKFWLALTRKRIAQDSFDESEDT